MKTQLRAWMAIIHPRYRLQLFLLLTIASLAGCMIFLENSLLQALVQEINPGPGSERGTIAQLAAQFSSTSGTPFLFLLIIFLVGLCRAGLTKHKTVLSQAMFLKSKEDMERVILNNLMLRGDDFYADHSLGEIINRLEVDVGRVVERRLIMVDVGWCLLMIFSNLLFFGLADWRLTVAVFTICLAGGLYTHLISKPIQKADKEYYDSNDQVKMDFEDYLAATPEIQTSGFFEAVTERFRIPQGERRKAFLAWVKADAKIRFVQIIWPVSAFLFIVLLILLAQRLEIMGYSARVSLVPVLIFALPGMFENITSLISLRIQFQLAANSMQRLLQYEKHPQPQGEHGHGLLFEHDPNGLSVELYKVTSQYKTKKGEFQGGVVEVDSRFAAGQWIAIVGGAGSGKSTLINVILGRQQVQNGSIRYTTDRSLTGDQRDLNSLCTLMPQKVVIFDATLRENIFLGRPSSESATFSDRQLEILESIGLAPICRLKSLEMRPMVIGRALSASDMLNLRVLARQAAARCRVTLLPFEERHANPSAPGWDALLGGRTDADLVLSLLCGKKGVGLVKGLCRSGLSGQLIDCGRKVLERSRTLLALESYEEYCKISVHKIEHRVWLLRQQGVSLLGLSKLNNKERSLLVLVGLTAMPKEWCGSVEEADGVFERLRGFTKDVARFQKMVQRFWQPYDMQEIHPYMDWRENILFGAPVYPNSRVRRELDNRLLELLAADPWSRFFMEQGLEYVVGRGGSRLSGGQRQLVALGRALLRETDVLVLDEPTSALDPANRRHVTSFLRQWQKGRIVITITHDPEFASQADEIQVLSNGRLADRGTFDHLSRQSTIFQEIFKKEHGRS